MLTVSVGESELRLGGVLRAYYSLYSIRGWVLAPPLQHGGFDTMRLTELKLEESASRRIVADAAQRKLCYAIDGTVFVLQRDDAQLTAPPRATRRGRYLYTGGRRCHRPEPWMLQ
ncbi:MAG TPA: hypothetical protein VE591_11535 [Candidatus Acidoferrum sp.]|nr:hypothetical protein [Candidatus Acidoferrum sp.]